MNEAGLDLFVRLFLYTVLIGFSFVIGVVYSTPPPIAHSVYTLPKPIPTPKKQFTQQVLGLISQEINPTPTLPASTLTFTPVPTVITAPTIVPTSTPLLTVIPTPTVLTFPTPSPTPICVSNQGICTMLTNFYNQLLSKDSAEKLGNPSASVLSQEFFDTFGKAAIISSIKTSEKIYGSIVSVENISDLYVEDEWAKQKIRISTSSGFSQTYKLILHKEKGEWKIFGTL